MLVTTRDDNGSTSSVPSLSSASIIRSNPSPCTFPVPPRTSAPMIEDGCRPPAVVIAVTSAVVVVFPWVPAIPTAFVAAHSDANMPDL